MALVASPIGLFDSGVGGLSILQAVRRELPHEDLLYFADQNYCPYGLRLADEIRALSARVTRFLLEQGCKAIVVACNTASAAALEYLRTSWPETPFIGMEPAVKPAAEKTRSGVVGVLATAGTLQGELFQRTRNRHARDVEVLVSYPTDWVERVERGEIDSADTEASVRRAIQPFLDAGADEIALGCTHYPFLAPLICQIAGAQVEVLDPSMAVARQTARVLDDRHLLNPQCVAGSGAFYTSGESLAFARVLNKLLGETANTHHADPRI
ncbi:MAG: glutamate racemase [Anaerolineae bacterium]